MAVKVIIHPGKKSEEEFKEAVEKYVRSWIFEKKGNYEKEIKTVDSAHAGSNRCINNNTIINA